MISFLRHSLRAVILLLYVLLLVCLFRLCVCVLCVRASADVHGLIPVCIYGSILERVCAAADVEAFISLHKYSVACLCVCVCISVPRTVSRSTC